MLTKIAAGIIALAIADLLIEGCWRLVRWIRRGRG